MKTLFVNPASGIAGDMFVGALLELGADTPEFWRQLRSLPLPANEWAAHAEKAVKHGIAATRYVVTWEKGETHDGHGRRLPEILELINKSGMTETAKTNAIKVFRLLAEVEAALHDTVPDKVHFHEVGAVDAIADICGVCIALDMLAVAQIVSAPPALGGGVVDCAHGKLAVPVPAVARLLEGVPVRLGPVDSELTTPTGAALLKALATDFSGRAEGTVLASGAGAGTKDFPEHANILPVLLLEKGEAADRDEVCVIECNLDDMPGERLSYLGPKLLEAGALDYTVTPCLMKKGRQGMIVQVLGHSADREKLVRLLLRETSSFGVRYQTWQRTVLRRETIRVETSYGQLEVKLGYDPASGELLQLAPEYESCRHAAEASGASLAAVYDAARAAAGNQVSG